MPDADAVVETSFAIAGEPAATGPADVCLLVEGTYPYVAGGVSSWVHDVICGHPELTFAVLYVGSYPGAQGEPRFKLPPNVVGLHRVFCQDAALAPLDGAGTRRAAGTDPFAADRDRRAARAVADAGRLWSACTSRAKPARTCWRRWPATI